jgi:hypothetical protein
VSVTFISTIQDTVNGIEKFLIRDIYCRKIVAWSALQFPWKYRPLNEEQKAIATSHEMPPLLEGMDVEPMGEFFSTFTCTAPYGYDAENDYRESLHPSNLPNIACSRQLI